MHKIKIFLLTVFICFNFFSNKAISDDRSLIICIFPESGKYEYFGDEFKNTLSIYLEEDNKSKFEFIFFDENLADTADILHGYLNRYASKVLAIIGPVSYIKTKEIVTMLERNEYSIPVYSISNESDIGEYPSVRSFGFSINDKLERLYEILNLEVEEYDNVYLIYNPEHLNKKFGKNFIAKVKEIRGDSPEVYRYWDVRRFSNIMKKISSDNKIIHHRSAIIFANLDPKIMKEIFKFIKKYQIDADDYELYFFNEIGKYVKIPKEYEKSVYEISYDLSKYSDFTKIYQNKYKKSPSLIAYSSLEALKEGVK